MTPIANIELNIEGLGTIKGNVFEHANQFLGIPYGYLAKRWSRATLASRWENEFHDGTKLASCVPVPSFDRMTDAGNPTSFPLYKPEPIFDEQSALVVNLTVPETKSNERLPVFVYIHGGAWMHGTANSRMLDGVNIVKKSVEMNKPIIHLCLNYRLGLGGFLSSFAIEQELKRDGFCGSGNFALTDQVLALEWIQEYIHLFGGDKDNVTVCGESAGAISVSNHIFSEINPRFCRAISMSGLIGTLPALSKEWHEEQYQKLLKYYNIENDQHALDKLRKIPQQEMAKNTHLSLGTSVPTTGATCIDGWYLKENIDFNNFPSSLPEWVEKYMVGDTKDEGVIFFKAYEGLCYQQLIDHCSKFTSEKVTRDILALYDIEPETPSEEFRNNMTDLAGDFWFKFPNYVLSSETKGNIYSYHFDEVSTAENSLKGKAHHAIDVSYVFGNSLDMSPEQMHLVNIVMSKFILFINGEEPWEKFSVNNASMVFGPVPGQCLSDGRLLTITEDTTRKYTRMQKVRQMPRNDVKMFFVALDVLTNER